MNKQNQDPRYEALCKEVERRGYKVEDVPRLLKEMREEILKNSKQEKTG